MFTIFRVFYDVDTDVMKGYDFSTDFDTLTQAENNAFSLKRMKGVFNVRIEEIEED